MTEAAIRIRTHLKQSRIDPLLFGHFIEQLGDCITGGVFAPGSPLADADGFRIDVLDKARELRPSLLRFPGGTVTKIYHWEDGIGPLAERRCRPNLIWGGEEDNLFGTNEFIKYCRSLNAEPYLSVNMGTGTAEEAARWVEYCNGTGNTYYANLRRQHGYSEPHKVKFWGLGNEEDSEQDCGRLQDPADYAAEAWRFAKLMKLQDSRIRLIVAGTSGNQEWNAAVLASLHPVADFLSAHYYFPSRNYSVLLEHVADFDQQMHRFAVFLATIPESPEPFSPWYRFPPRQEPVKLAIDEWGIWNVGQGPEDLWGLRETFTWQDALGVASWMHVMQRHSKIIGMATWAQMVNIIAPILANRHGSIRQPIFHALALYAQHTGRWNVAVDCETPPLDVAAHPCIPALDAVASLDEDGTVLCLAVVNRHPTRSFAAHFDIDGHPRELLVGWELSAASLAATNTLETPDRDCVEHRKLGPEAKASGHNFPPRSITMLKLA